jgi:hypothetical protein
MDLKPFRAGLGKLMAALVSLFFILTPMASALHVDAAPAAVCAAESGIEHAGNPDTGEHDHAQCAHGCGTCHFHLIGPGGLPAPALSGMGSALRPAFTDDVAASPPGGLFRPPRG